MTNKIFLAALLAACAFPATAQTAVPTSAEAPAIGRFSVVTMGEGPDVIFIPGLSSTRAVWADVAAPLASTHRVHLVQVAGFGEAAGANASGPVLQPFVDALADHIRRTGMNKPAIVGHSMGGWLALHAALRRKDRVAGLLGIAAAPDFTDWGYSADDKIVLLRDGKLERPNPYGPEPSVTHGGFWQSGEAMRLLWQPLDIMVPVRLVCGEKDAEVPIGVSLKLLEQLRSADVQMTLVKNSGHRLSEPHEIHAILVELQGLVEIAKR